MPPLVGFPITVLCGLYRLISRNGRERTVVYWFRPLVTSGNRRSVIMIIAPWRLSLNTYVVPLIFNVHSPELV